MVIFYVYMHERAKKSPFHVACTQIDEETFACEGKNFANRLTHVCVYVTEPKKSQPYPAQPGLTWRNQFLLVTQPI